MSHAQAGNFDFPDFPNSDGLSLGGLAAAPGSQLQLLHTSQSGEGSAWFGTRQDLQTFDTTFVFDLRDAAGISDGVQIGGDGFAFVAQNFSADPFATSPGSGLGYAGLLSGFAVEFDTYLSAGLDESSNHIAVYASLSGQRIQATKLAELAIPGDFYADGPRSARVAFDGSTLDVYLDDLSIPRLSVTTNVAGIGLPQAIGYVGFTAGSASARGTHAIQSWSFSSSDRLIIYVDDDAPMGGVGRTWSTAHRFLQDAVSSLNSTDTSIEVEVRIGQGIYYPDEGAGQIEDDVNSTFFLARTASMLGGFAGLGAAQPDDQRPWLFQTILSGDLDQNDNLPGGGTGNNCNLLLDLDEGQGGSQSGVPIHLDGITFQASVGREGPSGVRLITQNDAPAIMSRCVIRSCVSVSTVGGMGQGATGPNFVMQFSAPTELRQVHVHSNLSLRDGAPALLVGLGSPAILSNCALAQNTGIGIDGDILNVGGPGMATTVEIHNSIIYNNSGGSFTTDVSDGVVFYSCIEGVTPPIGPGNTNQPPLFADPMSGDFTLLSGSPCIDAGDNTVFSFTPPLDLAGAPRYQDDPAAEPDGGVSDDVYPIIDMGPFEAPGVFKFVGDATWTDPLGGVVDDFLNWSPAPPGAANRAVFELSNQYTVDLTKSADNLALRVRGGDVTIDLNSFNYSLNSQIESAVIVAENLGDAAQLTIRNGSICSTCFSTLFSQTGEIGRFAGASGAMTIEGPRAEWFVEDDLVVGLQGAGALNITNGAIVDVLQATLGSLPGSSGSVRVLGNESLFQSVFLVNVESGSLEVGSGGTVRAGAPVLGGVVLFDAATLSGDGLIEGNVFNFGDVFGNRLAPGALAGLTITNSYRQFGELEGRGEVSGTLHILVDPVSGATDGPIVEGQASLAGGLIVDFSQAVADGQELPSNIQLLTAPEALGRFNVARMPGLPNAQDGSARRLQVVYPSSTALSADRGVVSVSLSIEPLEFEIDADRSFDQDSPGTPVAAVAVDIGDGQGGGPDEFVDLVLISPDDLNPTSAPGRAIVLYNAGVAGNGEWRGFTAGTAEFSVGVDPSAVACGDLNNDDLDDLVVANRADDSISILLNDGMGGLEVMGAMDVGDAPSSVVVHQLDTLPADPEDLDIAVANEGDNSVTILTNDGGSGELWLGVTTHSSQPVGDAPRWIATLKSDDDKWEDLLTANFGSSSLTLLATNGAPLSFLPMELDVGAGPNQVIASDLNQDGNPELISTGQIDGTISIIENETMSSGVLSFAPHVELSVGPNPRSIAALDLSDDLIPDLVIVIDDGTGSGNTLRVLRNDPDAQGGVVLATDDDLVTGSNPRFIVGADVDRQSGTDVIVIGASAGSSLETARVAACQTSDRGSEPIVENAITTIFENCPGDANGDLVVDFGDITSVLGNWLKDYSPGSGAGDANRDSIVDFGDITSVLGAWLNSCT